MKDQLRALGHRVALMFGRGVLRRVDNSGSRQTVQIELFKGELRDGVERMQNYGFDSHPLGGDVAVGFVGGQREHGIVLVIDDRRYRLAALQPGEVCMFDDLGNRISLLRDRVQVLAVQHLEASAPTTHLISNVTIDGSLTVNGDVASTGTVKNNGKNIGSTSTHGGVMPGSGNSGVVN